MNLNHFTCLLGPFKVFLCLFVATEYTLVLQTSLKITRAFECGDQDRRQLQQRTRMSLTMPTALPPSYVLPNLWNPRNLPGVAWLPLGACPLSPLVLMWAEYTCWLTSVSLCGRECQTKTDPESPCLNIGLGMTAVTIRTMMSTANGSHDKENWRRQYMWYTNFRRYCVVPPSSSLCFASS